MQIPPSSAVVVADLAVKWECDDVRGRQR
jgi:hypothetical protein